jgi:hypothetical protein
MPGVRLRSAGLGARGRTAAGGRRDPGRQDQPRPVRDWPGRRPLAVRCSAQRDRPRVRVGRIQFGVGGGGGPRPRQLRAGYRHRRFGPRAGRLERHRRAETHAWPAQHPRRGAGLPHARLRVRVRRQRGGQLEGDGRRCRLRRARRLFAPRADGGSAAPGIAHRRAGRPRILRRRPGADGVRGDPRAPSRRSGRHDRPHRLHAVPRCRRAVVPGPVGGRALRLGRRLHRRPSGRGTSGGGRDREAGRRLRRARRLRRPVPAGRAAQGSRDAAGGLRRDAGADHADDAAPRGRAGAAGGAERPAGLLHELRQLLRHGGARGAGPAARRRPAGRRDLHRAGRQRPVAGRGGRTPAGRPARRRCRGRSTNRPCAWPWSGRTWKASR